MPSKRVGRWRTEWMSVGECKYLCMCVLSWPGHIGFFWLLTQPAPLYHGRSAQVSRGTSLLVPRRIQADTDFTGGLPSTWTHVYKDNRHTQAERRIRS